MRWPNGSSIGTAMNRQIEIQLSRAASAARNVTVIVTARLQRFNLTERLSAETMRMVNWDGAKTARHLLTFQSNEPYAVVPVGKLPEVAADTIDANDRPLLDPTTDNKIFDITEAGKNAGVQFAVRRGQFAAHIDLEMTYENEVLRQEYRITAEPTSGPIDRMLVYATDSIGRRHAMDRQSDQCADRGRKARRERSATGKPAQRRRSLAAAILATNLSTD